MGESKGAGGVTLMEGISDSATGAVRLQHEQRVKQYYALPDMLISEAGIKRLLWIAITDTLRLENSIARNRLLMDLAEVIAAVERGEP